ncbi:WD40-repeat-containing domain protein [Suillus americanus]|nr:WD40-repeat-containing domain protein [Suillus americanus]
MRGHTDWVQGVVHLPGGRHILTCSVDGSLRLWDIESGTQMGEDWRDEENNTGVWSMALSPNGRTVASGSSDRKVRLWDVETRKVVAKWTGHTNIVWSLCWSADGNQVGSGSWDGTARVWDVKSGKTVLTIETGHLWVNAVTYSPDATQFAIGGRDENAIKIWDAKTGALFKTLKQDEIVWSLVWGNKLVCSDRIFDTGTWEEIAVLEDVTAISLSLNGPILASALLDKTVRLWNLDTNLPIGPPLYHEDFVKCVALSSDGKVLVTGCEDGNAYTWDIHAILKEAGLEKLLQSLSNSNAARRPPIQARRIPPAFFDGVQNGAHSTTARSTHRSPANNPHASLFGRFSSLFRHSQRNIDDTTELRQRPWRSIFFRGPRIVQVPLVKDREVIFTAPPPPGQTQQQTQSHAQGSSTTPPPPGTNPTTLHTKHTHSLPVRLLAHLVLFLCCASPQHANINAQPMQQHGQPQGQAQGQASSSQTQPAATSTSTTLLSPAPSTAASGTAVMHS